jgi:hypothetical protein
MLTRGIEGIETRMIGRDAELKRLQELFSQAISKAAFSLVTICGEAGVGKSRLVQEFDQWVDGLAVRVRYFKGRAGLDLQRTPYSLLRDLFAYRFQILDTDGTQPCGKKWNKACPRRSDRAIMIGSAYTHISSAICSDSTSAKAPC